MESRLTYTYDNVNNRLTQVDNDGVVTTWLYDKAYQLLNERCDVESAPYNVTYTYDPVGNRLTENDGDVVTTNTYDDANQLILKVKGSEVTTYTYDDCGNQTVKEAPDGDTHSTYDAANQATEIEPPSGLVEFVYNAMYQRVRKVVEDGAVTKFIYDVKTLLAETDDSDDTTKSLTSESSGAGGEYGDLISEYDPVNLTESYPSYDAQWSTRELLDENCGLKASYRTRAFGLRSQASSPDWSGMSAGQWDNLSENGWNTLPVRDAGGTFGFGGQAGYYFDQETELYLMGGGAQGRYYDPALGRFTTQDPIGLSSGDTNLYRYVGNNPINRIDPSGNQEEEQELDRKLATGRSEPSGLIEPAPNESDSPLPAMIDEINAGLSAFVQSEIPDQKMQEILEIPDSPFRLLENNRRLVTLVIPGVGTFVFGRQARTGFLPIPGPTADLYWKLDHFFPGSNRVTLELVRNHEELASKTVRAEANLASIRLVPLAILIDYLKNDEGTLTEVAILTAGDSFLLAGVALKVVGRSGLVGRVVNAGAAGAEATAAVYSQSEALRILNDGDASSNAEGWGRQADVLFRVIGLSFSYRQFRDSAASAVKKRLKTPKRLFTSRDKHVGETATRLDELFPGRVIGVNMHLPANVAGGTREVDIVMDQFIIQVKQKRGKGLAGQIQQTEATLIDKTRRVIGYAPDNYSVRAWTGAANEGIPIARSFDELIAIIKELSN